MPKKCVKFIFFGIGFAFLASAAGIEPFTWLHFKVLVGSALIWTTLYRDEET